MFDQLDTQLLWQATGETVYMVAISTFFSALIGIPLGVLLVITDKGHLWEHVTIQRLLGVIVNLFPAVPFIVLVLFLFPAVQMACGDHPRTDGGDHSPDRRPTPFMPAWWRPPSGKSIGA